MTRIKIRVCEKKALAGLRRAGILAGTAALLLAVATACGAQDKKDAKQQPGVPAEKVYHNYRIHQAIELGGRYTTTDGSAPMWATLFNAGSGGRILSQSLDMRSTDTSKTKFFDNLSTFSEGYGGDATNVSWLKMNKGRWYDFYGAFHRDRNYFNDNLLANSMLTTTTATAPVLVKEPDSLHPFNTVRRNTDVKITLMPISRVNYRLGYNHNTNEGPSYSSIHSAGDTQVMEWFRNSADTYTGGIDVRLAKRTTLSYDQFLVYYRGDNWFQLAPAMAPNPQLYVKGTTTPVSLGFDVLGGSTTCGSGVNAGPEVSNGNQVNPYCTGALVENGNMPIRTHFPTEQLRLSSHYWDKVTFNARVLYSGGATNIKGFNQFFNGWNSRAYTRQESVTGGMANGQMAHNTRANLNADGSMIADLNKYFTFTDTFDHWNSRTGGYSQQNITTWTVASTVASTTSMLTPISSPTVKQATSTTTVSGEYLDQKLTTNTALLTANFTPQVKFSGGWVYRIREINNPDSASMTWHGNGMILGTVMQPSPMVHFSVNFTSLDWSYASGISTNTAASALPLLSANSYTRAMPNGTWQLRARATVKPYNWLSLAFVGNSFTARNSDPKVNGKQFDHNLGFSASLNPNEKFGADFSYSFDEVMSQTDMCYVYTANANAPLPVGATNAGTCVKATNNSQGATTLYLSNAYYDAPSNFFYGNIRYTPVRYLHLNGGARVNSVDGSAELLNPYMGPGGVQSTYLTPYADVRVDIAKEWSWHGNWVHDAYNEHGPQGTLPSRDTRGNVLTLGVQYAF